jgi:hypothetical protein
MLFFDISTWDPQDNEKVIEHFKNLKPPAGINVINQWVDLNGCRYFILYEAESNEAYAEFNIPWSDVCLIDSVPVMESTDFIKLMIAKGL